MADFGLGEVLLLDLSANLEGVLTIVREILALSDLMSGND
jgi:hypothetical protein